MSLCPWCNMQGSQSKAVLQRVQRILNSIMLMNIAHIHNAVCALFVSDNLSSCMWHAKHNKCNLRRENTTVQPLVNTLDMTPLYLRDRAVTNETWNQDSKQYTTNDEFCEFQMRTLAVVDECASHSAIKEKHSHRLPHIILSSKIEDVLNH